MPRDLNELWSLLNFVLPDVFQVESWFDFSSDDEEDHDDALASRELRTFIDKMVSSLPVLLKRVAPEHSLESAGLEVAATSIMPAGLPLQRSLQVLLSGKA